MACLAQPTVIVCLEILRILCNAHYNHRQHSVQIPYEHPNNLPTTPKPSPKPPNICPSGPNGTSPRRHENQYESFCLRSSTSSLLPPAAAPPACVAPILPWQLAVAWPALHTSITDFPFPASVLSLLFPPLTSSAFHLPSIGQLDQLNTSHRNHDNDGDANEC